MRLIIYNILSYLDRVVTRRMESVTVKKMSRDKDVRDASRDISTLIWTMTLVAPPASATGTPLSVAWTRATPRGMMANIFGEDGKYFLFQCPRE